MTVNFNTKTKQFSENKILGLKMSFKIGDLALKQQLFDYS